MQISHKPPRETQNNLSVKVLLVFIVLQNFKSIGNVYVTFPTSTVEIHEQANQILLRTSSPNILSVENTKHLLITSM